MPMKLHRDQFRWKNGRGHDQKPILYSQKANTYGLGKKQHDSDQWWTKAFDNQLKSLDVSNSTSGEVTVKQTVTNATPLGMAITSRYYIKFVSGGILKGDVETAVEEKELDTDKKSEEKEKTVVKKEKKEKKEKKKTSKNSSSRSSQESSSIAEGKRIEKNEKNKKKRKAEETRAERKGKKRLKRLLEKEMASLQALSVEA
ncbi:hypothetical protein FN846DRAFT_907739 [Sphaerosporella brunnea]|uniref:Uncharacterized protein n=1 Tax=Sphaerosporella brunnea TaxID=1250544 RepID=A0A5J5EW95_9PEZI|nr:hypothetical protein FN846DRAFT_907739 [Sphaerosporella brunnea]